MRKFLLKTAGAAPFIAAMALFLTLCFAVPCDSFASDDDQLLKERYIWFSYAYNECNGKAHPDTGSVLPSSYSDPEHFVTEMMLCDSDHAVYVHGDGVTDDNVTLTSLDPSVLEVDSSGNVVLHKTGAATIRATVAADEEYKECTIYLDVKVDRHVGYDDAVRIHFEGDLEAFGLADIDTGGGPRKLVIELRPGASVKYSTVNPSVIHVDQNGVVTPLAPGRANVRFTIDDGGGIYKSYSFAEGFNVTGESLLISPQEITGNLGPFTIDWHDGLQLDLHAETAIEYQVISGACASVDQTGHVEFSREGTAVIKATAVRTDDYLSAEVTILITARDNTTEGTTPDAEGETTQISEQEAARIAKAEALRKEIAKAKALKRPTLKVKALKGRKNKLTWSKVANADGYIVYVRYPGKKKYVKATSRKAKVKSVTHKGLSKRKVYRYKVRAYKKVNGKIYYSPYSKVKKVRTR